MIGQEVVGGERWIVVGWCDRGGRCRWSEMDSGGLV